MSRSNLGTIIAFPFNVPMPYQVDPVSGKLVQAPSLLKMPGQGQGPGGSACGCHGGHGGHHHCYFHRHHNRVQFPRLSRFMTNHHGLSGLGQDDGGDGGGDGFSDGAGLDSSAYGPLDTGSIPGYNPVDTSESSDALTPAEQQYLDTGEVYDPDTGITDYPNGNFCYSDGSCYDQYGNSLTQAQAASGQPAQSGSGSSSAGGAKGGGGGGGSGSQQCTPLMQMLGLCGQKQQQPGQTSGAGGKGGSSSSSASAWFSKNWGWLAGLGALVFVVPAILPGRR